MLSSPSLSTKLKQKQDWRQRIQKSVVNDLNLQKNHIQDSFCVTIPSMHLIVGPGSHLHQVLSYTRGGFSRPELTEQTMIVFQGLYKKPNLLNSLSVFLQSLFFLLLLQASKYLQEPSPIFTTNIYKKMKMLSVC